MEKELAKIPFVGAQNLTWFYSWCRDHGIPGKNEKLKNGLIHGIFGSAAIAVPSDIAEDGYDYFIFPRRLEEWARENMIDER